MRFGDLAREQKPDPGAGRLRREKRDEQVRRVGEARPFIRDEDLDLSSVPAPRKSDSARVARSADGVGGVSQKVDQDLFELIGVGLKDRLLARFEIDRDARFERRHTGEHLGEVDRLGLGRGESRELSVAVEKPAERGRAGTDDLETALEIGLPVLALSGALGGGEQAVGD